MRYFILFSLFFISCQSKREESDKHKVSKEPIEIKLTDADKKESIVEYIYNPTVIKLKTDYKLMGVGKVIFFKNEFYVLDKKTSQLLVFNDKGNFNRKIGKRGGGPGEFKKISDFEIDKKNNLILVLSVNDRAVYKYSYDGNFKERIRLNFFVHGFVLSDDGSYVFMLGGRSSDNFHTLIRTDSKGDILNLYFPFPKDIPDKSIGFSGGLHKQGKTNYFTQEMSSIIYQINDSIIPLYQFNFGKKTWKEEDKFKIDLFIKELYRFNVSYLHNFYCDTNLVLAFSFAKGNFLRRGFYFKQSNKVIAVPYNLKDDTIYRLFQLPVGVKNKMFISYVGYELYQGIFKSKDQDKRIKDLKEAFPALYDDFEEFSLNDNPYLLIYEIKDHN